MKKIFTAICLLVSLSVQAAQLGVYSGSVTINGTSYNASRIYVLPGAEANTLTCVVGQQVLVNIPSSSIVLSAQEINANYAITNGGFVEMIIIFPRCGHCFLFAENFHHQQCSVFEPLNVQCFIILCCTFSLHITEFVVCFNLFWCQRFFKFC